MPQLDPTWFASQLFWLFAMFMVLYVVMARFMLPPLMSIMASRKITIENDLSQAQDLKEKAEHARDDYQRTLTDARLRSQQLIDEAVADQKAASEKAGKEMDAMISTKLKEAQSRIGMRKAELIDHLVPTAGELTTMIVEKLTNKPASPERVAALMNELSKPQNHG